jgi:hypothetical protein
MVRVVRAGWAGLVVVGTLACARASVPSSAPREPLREAEPAIDLHVDITSPAYGGAAAQPDAIVPGERLELATIGALSLHELRGAGPLVLVWIGGAEHAELVAWLQGLAAQVTELDARAITLVVVRPLPQDRAEAFAMALRLPFVVAADEAGALADAARWSSSPTWAVLVEREGTLVYRKLDARLPALDELLAASEGRALRCCPGACEPVCE